MSEVYLRCLCGWRTAFTRHSLECKKTASLSVYQTTSTITTGKTGVKIMQLQINLITISCSFVTFYCFTKNVHFFYAYSLKWRQTNVCVFYPDFSWCVSALILLIWPVWETQKCHLWAHQGEDFLFQTLRFVLLNTVAWNMNINH